MTDSTLSPAASAVLDAYAAKSGWLGGPLPRDYHCIAAALRAAADRVAPAVYFAYSGNGDWDHGMEAKNDEIREAILAIADELEAQ
jgi:hypothetical protein